MQQKVIDEISPILQNHAEDSDFISSFARGMVIFQILSMSKRTLTISDISKITTFPRATVRRGLYTLEKLGYVTHEERYYSLTSKVLTLAHSYLTSQTLPNAAQPILESMTREINESSSMAILVQKEVIYVARASSRNNRIIADTLSIGSHLPAYCSSMGRVLLAAEPEEKQLEILQDSNLTAYTEMTITEPEKLLQEFAKVQEQGFALIDQELEIGLYSIAVPVLNRSGETVAAININTHAQRSNPKEVIEKYLPVLQRTATLITSFI